MYYVFQGTAYCISISNVNSQITTLKLLLNDNWHQYMELMPTELGCRHLHYKSP